MPVNSSLDNATAIPAITSFINRASVIPDSEEYSDNKEADTSDNEDNKNSGSRNFSFSNYVFRHIRHKVPGGKSF